MDAGGPKRLRHTETIIARNPHSGFPRHFETISALHRCFAIRTRRSFGTKAGRSRSSDPVYISHQFSDQKMKWPTIERETFAIIYSLEKLRPIVIGTDITVFTDHKPLKHLFTSEMKNPRIQRWAIILGEYNCNIENISGPKNIAADMLSRLQNTSVAEDLEDNEHLDWQGDSTNINAIENSDINVVDNAVEVSEDPSDQTTPKPLDYHSFDHVSLQQAQRTDPEISQLLLAAKTDPQGSSKYCLENELLYHIERGTKTRPHTKMQLVLPPSFRKLVLQDAHDGFLGGHLGIEKTTDKVMKSYFWPTMLKDIMHYVQSCETCNRKKLHRERRPMQDMPMPAAPMEIVGIRHMWNLSHLRKRQQVRLHHC